MKVCFTGLGSIAGRHIRNLKDLYGQEISVTVLRSGKGRKADADVLRLTDRICSSPDELEENYDAFFITNPSSLHYGTVCRYISRSSAFFIEKPVFVTGKEDISLFRETGKVFYVACPLRYTNTVQYMKQHIDFSKVYSIRCISSSYLPDWRRNVDYRNTYSAHRELGGGAAADLIHEWDYLSYLAGFPDSVKSIISKKSALDIDSDDIAVYIAEYPDKIAEVHLDYFGREAVRRIELFAQDDTVAADLLQQRIQWLKAGQEIILPESRDDYQKKELEHFMKIARGEIPNDNGLEHACRTLRIARGENT